MKMLLAIVRDADLDKILNALLEESFRVTRIASSGGFFRRGNATLMLGVTEKRVDQALHIIQENCAPSLDLAVKHATVFVLDVDRFEQF
ncbi:MAG: hypothetical protein HN392_10665 [Anaerolineae bacterium]|nr:hypothetical protein [Anaerolineae bacterium]MBT7075487.1 hypothetical protein [Anaerolineae bacterium]MBT7781538.1 hypothetical protein [Anaerolineae bacterium]